MSKLRLTLACWNYDRTSALINGRTPAEGIDLHYLTLPVEETFFRMMRHQEFDIAEMSLSSYTISLFRENPPFIAIPVFPSRSFRHSGIFINANSGIQEPKDLIDKRVGTPEYQLTAIVWIRGILADEYDVAVGSVSYFTGGLEEPGRIEKANVSLPPQIRVQAISPECTLSRMLADGEVDAVYAPRAPSSLYTHPDRVNRLFPNYPEVEQNYYRKTKIFPIMHVLAIRREVYEKNRWVAGSLYKAFLAAMREAYEDLHETAALKVMLPWLASHLDETERLLGKNFWPYGLEPNVETLATFLRYSHEQGLSKRQLEPRELFAPETLESYKI